MKIVNDKILYSTRWLSLKERTYLDMTGKEKKWIYTERTGKPGVVTVICRSKNSEEILLVKQFRVPFGGYVIEFPAGLIDDGESPEDAAKRELLEETGYEAEILEISPPLSKSAGLTDETTYIVIAVTDPANKMDPAPEASEDITVIWTNVSEFFERFCNEKSIISATVWAYMMGRSGKYSLNG